MSGYAVIAYDVNDPETYAKYNPGSLGVIMETIGKHGGEVMVATGESKWLHDERGVTVIIKFPSVDAAQAWLDDPAYAEAKKLRLASTENIVCFIAPEFVMPS